MSFPDIDAMIESGEAARMGPDAFLVFCAVAASDTPLSPQAIATRTGLAVRRVERSLTKLVAQGRVIHAPPAEGARAFNAFTAF